MRWDRLRKLLIIFIIALVCAAVFIIVVNFDKWLSAPSEGPSKGALETQKEMKTVYLNGEPYLPRKDISTFLIIGVDKLGQAVSSGSYNNTDQADFLLLVVLDNKAETYKFFHINRDTMTQFDVLGVTGTKAGVRTAQIALSHTYGNGLKLSCENTVKAVSDFLYGIHIDHYASLTMSAVPVLNDYIGGVEITFEDDYSEIDPRFVPGATVILEGETALGFIRARSSLSDSSNTSRMKRQQLYLTALINTLADKNTSTGFMYDAYEKAEPYMVTDCDAIAFNNIFNRIKTYEFDGVCSPEGEARVGSEFMEFYINKEKLETLISGIFYDKSN